MEINNIRGMNYCARLSVFLACFCGFRDKRDCIYSTLSLFRIIGFAGVSFKFCSIVFNINFQDFCINGDLVMEFCFSVMVYFEEETRNLLGCIVADSSRSIFNITYFIFESMKVTQQLFKEN